MFYVQDVMCCVQYDKHDDEYNPHGMNFVIKILKAH